jgi:hypothetical protein
MLHFVSQCFFSCFPREYPRSVFNEAKYINFPSSKNTTKGTTMNLAKRGFLALGLITALMLPLGAFAEARDDDRDDDDSRKAAKTIVVNGFIRSESAIHDIEHDYYLVSNITNGPRDTDNSGFISRVKPNGKVKDLKWIEGGQKGVTLNAPKGMAIANGILYVADIDNLRKFNVKNGKPLGSIFFPGATFLNDVTSDGAGNVFVTDSGFTTVPAFGPSGTDAIYKVTPNNVVSSVAAGNSLLNHPNGIVALPNGKLKVVTFDPFNGTKELYTIDMMGVKSEVITMPTGFLDGIVAFSNGFLVSSWVGFSTATNKLGKVYFVALDGTVTTVASDLENPADIGFDFKRNRLLIPELPDDNRGALIIKPL